MIPSRRGRNAAPAKFRPVNEDLEKLLAHVGATHAQLYQLYSDLRQLGRFERNGSKPVTPLMRPVHATHVTGEALRELENCVKDEIDRRELSLVRGAETIALNRPFHTDVLRSMKLLDGMEEKIDDLLNADGVRESVLRELREVLDMCERAQNSYSKWQDAEMQANGAAVELRQLKPIEGEEEERVRLSQEQARQQDRADREERRVREYADKVTSMQGPLAKRCAVEYVRSIWIVVHAMEREIREAKVPIDDFCHLLLEREHERISKSWPVLAAEPQRSTSEVERV
ncbi:hypothetical protein FVE85_3380 [Porphyridium purpureum]|uniref:Uncharacterized protein n=1 Tax=Porphyridium purpureum TaxID=35688 RepID=A0A5J4YUG1_PORPP|nr:hypothetical protein FVE85_3380 [Porphyridium purpureum]|eukprot:POR3582..scf227_4